MTEDIFYCPFNFPTGEVILENNLVYAIYDKYPVSRGHALVIPKRHATNYFKLTLEEQAACQLMLNILKKIIDKKYHPDGYNVGVNVGDCAGQTVRHVSIHLIPRYNNDADSTASGVRNVIVDRADYLNQKEKWDIDNPSNFSNIQARSDAERMKAFCNYLDELFFYTSDFIDATMHCVDANNTIIPVGHQNIYEAYLAGKEVAISLCCSIEEDENGQYFFIDNEWRAPRSICHKPYLESNPHLNTYQCDNMVLTIQNDYKIKRFGIIESTNDGNSVFFEHPLYKELTDAMEELIEGF